jgi:glycosyltransferase involved in cell wall biosynthesis
MAAGCVVIGSRTRPVEEAIRHEQNGLLIDFFSPQELIDAVQRVCNDPTTMRVLQEEARRTIIERYDLNTVCLPKLRALIEHSGSAPHS